MTLVELMMVIAVMGILTVLMLGSMSAVHSHAASASNQSNMIQLGMAMSMYTDDAGVYPPLAFDVQGTEISVVARQDRDSGFDSFDASLFVSPHHRSTAIRSGMAPAHTVPVIRQGGETVDMPISYGYNIEVVRHGIRARRMARPQELALLFDGSMSGPDGGGVIEGDYQADDSDAGVLDREKWLDDATFGVQLKFIDILYADGHVHRQAYVAPNSLSVATTH